MAKEFKNPEGEITPVELADPTQNLKTFENIYNPANDIKSDPTKPGAIDIPLSPENGAEALIDNMTNNLQQVSHNPYVQAKAQHFDASMEGTKYERYYSHPKFKALGFNPFRDNETVYNENSSTLDDMSRAMTQWHKVVGLGAMDAAGFGSITDVETAKDFKRYMAIGSSTKEGAGAFATNMLMNTGYTIGIMAEVALEEIILAAATVGTAGLASEVTVPLMIARGVRASNKLYKGAKIVKNLTKTLDAFKDASKARKYFADVATGAAKFMNPLENTVDFMRGMDKVKGLDNVAKTAGAFTSFYKDVRMARLAWGEAGLEGGMVRDDLEKELLAEHLSKNGGRAPTNEEAATIKQVALEAGTSTGYWNVGAIFFSNKIVFDGINTPFKNLRRFGDDVFDGMAGKIIQKRGVDVDPFEAAKKGFAGLVQTAKNPRAYGRTALSYTKANFAEGLQESAQEVIGGVFSDVAKAEWQGNPVKGGYYASLADNLQKQMTPEGMEVFMSGFLMGGLIHPATVTLPNYVKQGISKFRNGENYSDLKKQKEEYLNKTVNDLNELWNDTGEILAPDLDNLNKQAKYKEGMEEASRNGDAKTYHDLEDDGFYEHVYTALSLGRFDTFVERLEDMKQFTPEEIAADPGFKKQNLSQADYLTGMDKAIVRAKRIQQRYDYAQTKMPNPYSPNTYKKGSDAYKEESARKQGWEDAQRQFVFLQNTFDTTVERMTAIMSEAQTDANLAEVATSDFNAMFRLDTMDQELLILQAEIASMEGVKGVGYTDVTEKRNKAKKKLKLLQTFRGRMALVKTSGKENAKQAKLQEKYIRDAKRAYNSYLKNLADVSGDYAFNDALDNSFDKLVEYYLLNNESRELNNAVNEMINPGSFNRFAGQKANLRNLRKNQQQKEIRDSLKSYLDMIDKNRMMQVLYEYVDKNGKKKPMFFDPKELEDLMEKGILPKTFYYGVDLNSSDELVRVMPNDPNLREARKIIEKFVDNLTDIPIDEASREMNPYDSTARPKAENDLRSYSDLAKQYGFVEEEDTVVPLRAVLETLINSEYATDSEIELAKELVQFATEGETVTFVSTLSRPGEYSISGQTLIDPRYMSENYDNGGKPIEFVILHEEIHRRTVDALANDREFRLKIVALREAAAQYAKENDMQEQYGLKNNEEFVAEAMSNPKFQETLANIPYNNEGGTVWSKFVDSVVDMLKVMMGKDVSNTALTEALNVITVKISDEFTKKADTTKEKISEKEKVATSENTMLSKDTPVKEIVDDHPELANALLSMYRAENSELMADGDDALDPDLDNLEDEEALASLGFEDYVKDKERSSTQKRIDKYNKDKGRDVKPPIDPVTSGDVTIMSMGMRERLEELGFDPGDYNVAQAQVIINAGKKKSELEAEVAEALKEQQDDFDRATQEMRESIAEQIGTAKDLEDLDLREQAALDMLDRKTGSGATGWATTGLTSEDIDAMKTLRKEELAFSFEIGDIYPGMVVKLSSKANFIIDKVTKKEVIGHRQSDKNKKPVRIAADKVKTRIKYIYKRSMEDPEITTPTEPISPEAEKLSNEIQDTSKIINNKDATAEADKFGKEGGDTGWLDNINECE